MRDIKFRVYVRFLQKVCNVTDIDLTTGSVCVDGYPYGIESDAVDLMQFTGLTDKNGVDIYEGYLIKNQSGRVCSVVFNEHGAMFDAECDKTSWKDTDSLGFKTFHWSRHVEVIGNIYQGE